MLDYTYNWALTIWLDLVRRSSRTVCWLSICWFTWIQADSGGTHLVLRPSEGTAWGEGEGRDGAYCERHRTASQTTVTYQHAVRSVWSFYHFFSKLKLYMYLRGMFHINISFRNHFFDLFFLLSLQVGCRGSSQWLWLLLGAQRLWSWMNPLLVLIHTLAGASGTCCSNTDKVNTTLSHS